MADDLKRGEKSQRRQNLTSKQQSKTKGKQLRKSVPGEAWGWSSCPDEHSEGEKEWLSKHSERFFFFLQKKRNVANGRIEEARQSEGWLRVTRPFSLLATSKIFGSTSLRLQKSICQKFERCRLSTAPSNLSFASHYPHGWLALPVPWEERWLEVNAVFQSCYWLHVSLQLSLIAIGGQLDELLIAVLRWWVTRFSLWG